MLWHFRIGADDDWDDDGDERLVGFYSSEAAAQDAMTRLRGQPGVSDWPRGFAITACRLDEDMCAGGFGIGPEAGAEQP